MLWFIIHNILKLFSSIENQTRNLITFLTGTILYVLFYSYAGSLDLTENIFLKRLFVFFIYIIIADGFVMAILYKNFYKQTIFTEVKETIGSTSMSDDVEPTSITNKYAKNNNPIMCLLNHETYETNFDNGFAKDSALGEAFNTGGKSNNN